MTSSAPSESEVPHPGGACPIPMQLEQALASWRDQARPQSLRAWLRKELDAEGTPKTLPARDWWRCWSAVEAARDARAQAWPSAIDAALAGFARSVLRFSTPDGKPVWNVAEGPGRRLREWVDRLPDDGLRTLARHWFPNRDDVPRRREPATPITAMLQERRPLAVLRADWERRGDLLAVDQRDPSLPAAITLIAGGARLIGTSWGDASGPSRTIATHSGVQGDFYEWSVRDNQSRRLRTVALLPGRKVALIAEQVETAAGAATSTLELFPGVTLDRHAESGSFTLSSGDVRARVVPLAVPFPAAREQFHETGRRLQLTIPDAGPRRWLPILISWDATRLRRELVWRVLTVTERAKVCHPSVAFAARVGWGRGEGLVVYRSLAKPAPRTFLGHATAARFLFGRFTAAGVVEPLIEIE